MADADPNITNTPLEGPYAAARSIIDGADLLPPIGPPAPPCGSDRLILIRRSVLSALIEHEVDAIPPAIEALDGADGDVDVEPNGDEMDGDASEDDFMDHNYDGPGCPVADPDAASLPEWHTLGRHKAPTLTRSMPDEDAEDDDPDISVEDDTLGFDPEEDMCLAGDDRVFSGPVLSPGVYGADNGAGDADDAEREQMAGDVPCLPVYAIEPNPFDGKRKHLGISNLMTSFVSNGSTVRSAETGNEHCLFGRTEGPGTAV